VTPAPPVPLLAVEHLTMRFGGLIAIDDLSFSANKGEITAIIGPNGAGKTTVFNCITGFYKPTSGRLVLSLGGASVPADVATLTASGRRFRKTAAGAVFLLERMPDQLRYRLFRPLINRILKRHRFRGRATPPLDYTSSTPYASLMKACGGSPIAPALTRTLEEMWASPHLTRRCKLLMLAVIARGLACEVCALEVGEALQREGLKEAALTQVLTHLDAPELDPVERVLVPFARETIWFDPAPMQRRARALRDRLSSPQILEAIGVAALANGLCRMGAMVLDHP